MDMLCTSSPADIHYILSKNFPNYPKGDKFRQIFDILGEGVSNIDGDIWEFHRRTLMHLLNHPSFHSLVKKTIWNKVEKGLLPVLDNISREGVEADLQDIFQRFSFDIICESVFDYDAQSMSLDLPYIPCEKALSHAEEAIFCRHIMPAKLWKLQRLLRIGSEKKLTDAWKDIDQFIYNRIAERQKVFSNMNSELQEEKFNFLTALMREVKNQSVASRDHNIFLRDILLNLILAGRDTTSSTLSWFFYLVAKNPIAEDKIREEVKTQLKKEMGGKCNDLRAIELSNLVYLHGGLCEALRLFPAVPFQHKAPIQPDTLPSGHQVDRNTSIILCFYVTGRMESVWGKDCLEFKPERWFATGGGIEHQPSYKFPAFNAGPRTCLGKQMSFTQMKIVAATIIYHYHVELVKGHPVLPSKSFILEMKNGLKVRLVDPSMPLETYERITYPIPANDSVEFVYLFCIMITKTIQYDHKKHATANGKVVKEEKPKIRETAPPVDKIKIDGINDELLVLPYEGLSHASDGNCLMSAIEISNGLTSLDLLCNYIGVNFSKCYLAYHFDDFIVDALVNMAKEISSYGIPAGSKKINGKYIQSLFLLQLQGKYGLDHEQLKFPGNTSCRHCVQVMGSFDGWSLGEYLSAEYNNSYSMFSTSIMIRPECNGRQLKRLTSSPRPFPFYLFPKNLISSPSPFLLHHHTVDHHLSPSPSPFPDPKIDGDGNHMVAMSPFFSEIEQQLKQGENSIIYVAGDRVITDPLCKPFSMGRNLLCVYIKKKHMNDVPEPADMNRRANTRSLKEMTLLLSDAMITCILLALSILQMDPGVQNSD
ncbi:hypothetical protein L1987_15979 [Smallanthus sonchifolius]|uniref:Uncharacterized protein n=1 Tax=Smallanthus sonchifolius TaxID=185202 RepID=A0ACB9J994_9ASTR|nr:hypothetical protein L1987_15979 [Smallanthus sonchifolius]